MRSAVRTTTTVLLLFGTTLVVSLGPTQRARADLVCQRHVRTGDNCPSGCTCGVPSFGCACGSGYGACLCETDAFDRFNCDGTPITGQCHGAEMCRYQEVLECPPGAEDDCCIITSLGDCETETGSEGDCGTPVCASGVGTCPACDSDPGTDDCYPEICDGYDNDGDGSVDESCPSPDLDLAVPLAPLPECTDLSASTRVAYGAFNLDSRMDAKYEGSNVPLEFVRFYTSLDQWAFDARTRLALGWFTTYDERLFDAATGGPPSSTTAQVIHRTRSGRGRRFDCTTSPCKALDGSLDTLKWFAAGADPEHWKLVSSRGITTRFYGAGVPVSAGTLWDKKNARGQGWTVTYTTTGPLFRRIAYAQDHLGRRLNFNWEATETAGRYRLATLTDVGGTLLATFTHLSGNVLLASATSAAGTESYGYASVANASAALLKTVTVDGQAQTSVTYDAEVGEGTWGRVSSVVAQDGSFRFRYRGTSNPRNACTNPAISTLVIDRSTTPVQGSCTDNVAGDAWCKSMAGTLAVCDAGTCRAATCHEYGDVINGAGGDRVTKIEGNCACGGGQTFGWMSGGSEAPRRVQYSVARDGKITSFAYDTRGRVVARCDGDTDYVVTTTANSCPSTGAWKTWEYGRTDFPGLVTREKERSRLDAAQYGETQFTFDPLYPELTERRAIGLTRNLSDTNVTETQITTFLYDTLGRRTRITRPAGEVTSFVYSTQPGAGYGQLQNSEEWLDPVGTQKLTTSYSSYTVLGMPQTITPPSGSGTATTLGYDYGGMRLLTSTIAGQVTTYTYTTGGRLYETIEPSGRRTKLSYDTQGRVWREDVRDGPNSLAADRTEHTYDPAGRTTLVKRLRLDASGNPGATQWQVAMTYDSGGFEKTRTYGSRAAIQFTRDAYGLGRLMTLQREDGDQVTMLYDAFGRETEYRRHIGGGSSGAYTSVFANPSGNEGGDPLPRTITDPHAVVRSYVYDDFGRLVRSSSNDYGTVGWEYANGRLANRKLSNGKRTAYSYDQLGRVTLINHDADNSTMLGQDYAFVYQNAAGSPACGPTGAGSCAYRTGRLAIVQIEVTPAPSQTWWNLEYDYAADGQVTAELWPSSRQTTYAYDAQGRRLRMTYPVQTGDKLRYEYNAVANDGEDPNELVRLVSEHTIGVDYVVWARKLEHDATGRLTKAWFADRNDNHQPSLELTYNTDGTVNLWRGRRRSSNSDVDMMNRTYSYRADGMVAGYTSSVTADPARSFIYDGANRLTCAASTSGLSTCPTGSTLLERYTYDVHENRLTKVTPAGTTTYSNPNPNNQLYDEYPPGATIWYGYDPNMLGARTYDWHQSVTDPNERDYFYYDSGQLKSIALPRPGTTQGTYQNHEITILYDHIGRPIYIVDKNLVTSKERREQLYWDTRDDLVNRVVTPDHTVPATYTVEILAHLEAAAYGFFKLSYSGGSPTEERFYTFRDPAGLPPAAFKFTGVGATTQTWTADYQPFGEIRASSGTDPGLRQFRRFSLVGSASDRWSGPSVINLRAGVFLDQYDPRVGQRLSSSAFADESASESHPYSDDTARLLINPGGNNNYCPLPPMPPDLAPLPYGREHPAYFACTRTCDRRSMMVPCPPLPDPFANDDSVCRQECSYGHPGQCAVPDPRCVNQCKDRRCRQRNGKCYDPQARLACYLMCDLHMPRGGTLVEETPEYPYF